MTAVFERVDQKPCDCCQKISLELQPPENPPRQDTLQYRVGTYGSFYRRMIARLSEDQIPTGDPAAQRPLARLTARTTDDPAIALLEAWAVVADILTFYQERIANEGYVRTATERFSVLQLARMIGYELNPGVAASTYLAFTAESAPGAPDEVQVPLGTRVLSIPGQGERPQTFETVDDLLARPEWNSLGPDRSATAVVAPLWPTHVRLLGLSTGLNVGSGLLLEVVDQASGTQSAFRIASQVEPLTDEGWTRVEWSGDGLPLDSTLVGAHSFKLRVGLLGHNSPEISPLSTAALADYLRPILNYGAGVGVSPVGEKIVAEVGSNLARVWALDDSGVWREERAAALPDGTGEAAVLAVDDGATVAIGSVTGVVSVSDPAAEAVDTWKTAEGSAVSLLAFSENGSHLLARHADMQARVWKRAVDWRLEGLQVRSSIELPRQRFVVVNPGGELFVFTYQETDKTWEKTRLTTDNTLTVATLSGDGMRVLAGSDDGILCWWQQVGDQWSAVPHRISSHTGRIHEVALSTDGLWGLSRGADQTTKLWDLGSDAPVEATATWRESTLAALNDWPVLAQAADMLFLDAVYPSIVAGSKVVVVSPKDAAGYQVFAVEQAETVYATHMGVTGKVTRLRVSGGGSTDYPPEVVRVAAVYAQSELKASFTEEIPLEEPVMGANLTLAELHRGLRSGQTLAVAGKRMRAVHVGEPAELVAPDQFNSVTVSAGDLLEVVSAPVCLGIQPAGTPVKVGWEKLPNEFRPYVQNGAGKMVPGSVRWHLRDRNGFEGFLSVEIDVTGPPASEVRAIFSTEEDAEITEIATIRTAQESSDDDGRGRTRLELSKPLVDLFDRTTLHVNANVVLATHGETVEQEVLGGGDGSLANQEFVLNKTPLTYVSAPTPTGGESTLEVRANDVLWEEVSSLYGLEARSRAYTVRHDNEGKAHLIFGDGAAGARLPTGLENIVARYRSGIGFEGEVGANSLRLLQTKPLGVREVTNPLAARGAAAPETLEQARVHAPRKVLTVERIVSITDFEDFAASFAGVGKAKADGFRVGENRFAHITIANANGTPVDSGSALRSNLIAALNRVRDTTLQARVDTFVAKYFRIGALVRIDTPTFVAERVRAAIRAALRSAFVFEKRGFGQDVLASEIVQIMQQQEGVIAVRLTELSEDAASADTQTSAAKDEPPLYLPAMPARLTDNTVSLAEILLLSPADDAISLEDYLL